MSTVLERDEWTSDKGTRPGVWSNSGRVVVTLRTIPRNPALDAADLTAAAPGRPRPYELLGRYIRLALSSAMLEPLEEGGWYAHSPRIIGAWGAGATEEEAVTDLASGIRDWVIVKLDLGHRDFPVLGDIDLNRA